MNFSTEIHLNSLSLNGFQALLAISPWQSVTALYFIVFFLFVSPVEWALCLEWQYINQVYYRSIQHTNPRLMFITLFIVHLSLRDMFKTLECVGYLCGRMMKISYILLFADFPSPTAAHSHGFKMSRNRISQEHLHLRNILQLVLGAKCWQLHSWGHTFSLCY